MLSDSAPEACAHLRLHHGTVWRWNRLPIAFEARGVPHLRIEQRVMPAGPSIVDTIANAAFCCGCVPMLARRPLPPEREVSFVQTRDNFYRAARDGLEARIDWLDGRSGPVAELLERLLPLAREGLHRQDIAAKDIERDLDVIGARPRTRRNGAAWQMAHRARHADLLRLTADQLERQRCGMPVHAWPL